MPSLRCDAESDEAPRCRICFDGASEEDGDLIEPCACRGTQRYIHKSCLVRWQASFFSLRRPPRSALLQRTRLCVCKRKCMSVCDACRKREAASPLHFLLHFLTWRCPTNACPVSRKSHKRNRTANEQRYAACAPRRSPSSRRPSRKPHSSGCCRGGVTVMEAKLLNMLPGWRDQRWTADDQEHHLVLFMCFLVLLH